MPRRVPVAVMPLECIPSMRIFCHSIDKPLHRRLNPILDGMEEILKMDLERQVKEEQDRTEHDSVVVWAQAIFILPTYILFMLVGLLCYGLLGPSANAIHKLSWFNSLHFLENMSCATCNMQVNAGASGCLVPNGFVTFL